MPSSAPRYKPMPQLARRHEVPGAADKYGQGRGGRPWRRKRERILMRDGHLCQPCRASGFVTLANQVDHIVPQAEGGSDDDANLQAICGPCHAAKTKAEAGRGARRRGTWRG